MNDDIAQHNIDALNLVIEACARVVDMYAAHYPLDVFPAPPAGEHGTTVDSCSAAALRAVLPEVARDIRALKIPQGSPGG